MTPTEKYIDARELRRKLLLIENKIAFVVFAKIFLDLELPSSIYKLFDVRFSFDNIVDYT